MKITCPNCSTSYQVPDDYISAEGRSVRCANCGDTWHAVPEASPPKAPTPPPPVAPETAGDKSQDDIDALFDSPSEGKEQSQDDIDALFDSPSGGEEQSQDDIDALFDSPSGGEEQSQDDIDALFDSPSGGEDQSQDDIDALFDSPSGGEEQNQDDIDALFDSPSGGEDQSQDDIDSLFDNDDGGAGDGPTVITPQNSDDPMVVTGDDDRFESPVMDLMDAAAFEAQKKQARGNDIESSVQRKQRKKRKIKAKSSSKFKTQATQRKEWAIGGTAFVATLILIISLFAAPNFWTRSFPDLASLYGMLGMDINVAGVEIDAVHVELVQKAGAPVIAVEAELVNLGTEPVSLPSVRFSVLGNNDSELYSWDIDPDTKGLGPGERKTIKTSVAAPSQAKFVSLRMFH
nr:zinc-ribbon domain-containing protein [uncultured Cohaesibacter sp.]